MAIAFTTTVNTYSYEFDFALQYIYIDATLDAGEVEDLYTAIKEAQESESGMASDVIASGSGLDELDPGISTFLTVRLFDEWEIRSKKVSGKFVFKGGNIVKDNGKDPFYEDGSISYIAFFSQAGIKTTTTVDTGSGLSTEQANQLADLSDRLVQDSTIVEDGAGGFTQTFNGKTLTSVRDSATKTSTITRS